MVCLSCEERAKLLMEGMKGGDRETLIRIMKDLFKTVETDWDNVKITFKNKGGLLATNVEPPLTAEQTAEADKHDHRTIEQKK